MGHSSWRHWPCDLFRRPGVKETPRPEWRHPSTDFPRNYALVKCVSCLPRVFTVACQLPLATGRLPVSSFVPTVRTPTNVVPSHEVFWLCGPLWSAHVLLADLCPAG